MRERRLALGLSQTALAGEAFSPSYISLIEAGHREPTDAALATLAQRLDSTLEYLKHGEDGPNEARTRLELDYAKLELDAGDAVGARRRIVDLDLSIVTAVLREDALSTLARAHEALGDLERAVGILEPLLEAARARADHLSSARAAVDLVTCYLEAGDLGRSIEVGERVVTDLEAASLAGTDAHLQLASAVLWAYVERGDVLFATHRVSELIRSAESWGSSRGRGSIYWNAALVAEQRRDYDQAQRYTERALALLGESGAGDVARLRLNYAALLLRTDPPDPQASLAQIDEAQDSLLVVGSPLDLARIEVYRARALLLLGDAATAHEHAREGLRRLGEEPRLETATALVTLGDTLEAVARAAESGEVYGRVAQMLSRMRESRQSAAVWRDLGDRYRLRGELVPAAEAYDRALLEAGFRPAPVLSVMPAADEPAVPSARRAADDSSRAAAADAELAPAREKPSARVTGRRSPSRDAAAARV